MNHGNRNTPQSAFTLLELLAGLVILVILAAVLLTALSGLRSRAEGAVCLHQLRQIGVGVHLYLNEHNRTFFDQGPALSQENWISKIHEYTEDGLIFKCPGAPSPASIERTYMFNTTIGSSGPSATATLFGKNYHKVVNPDSTIMVFCVAYAGDARLPLHKVDTCTWTMQNDQNDKLRAAYPRPHSGTAVNVLFVGGNVGALEYPIADPVYHWDR